jgi:hypothetical protein
MQHNKVKVREAILPVVFLATFILVIFTIVIAAPIPPSTIENISIQTMGATGSTGTIFNLTGNGTHAGGYVFTLRIQSKVQNKKWKAFVGNATGRLTLDDGDGYTIFDWVQFSGSVTGEVYATRSSGSVNWSNINCTWGYRRDPSEYTNKTAIEIENRAMFLTSTDDNITTTFSYYNHTAILVGTINIPANNCSSLKTYVNSTAGGPLNQEIFTEVLLYDGTNESNGKVIYTTLIDSSNRYGYRNDSNYDFQMIVPENGSQGWNSATAYYFYVELEG